MQTKYQVMLDDIPHQPLNIQNALYHDFLIKYIKGYVIPQLRLHRHQVSRATLPAFDIDGATRVFDGTALLDLIIRNYDTAAAVGRLDDTITRNTDAIQAGIDTLPPEYKAPRSNVALFRDFYRTAVTRVIRDVRQYIRENDMILDRPDKTAARAADRARFQEKAQYLYDHLHDLQPGINTSDRTFDHDKANRIAVEMVEMAARWRFGRSE